LREKVENILIALEKIARETGEEEYNHIIFLASKKGIIITEELTSSLSYRNIMVWVLIPFIEEKFTAFKLNFNSIFPSNFVDKILQKIEKNNVIYIKYPESIQTFKIDEDIFEVLTEEHGIECNELNEAEWEKIKDTNIWKSSVVQIARELVAFKLIKDEKIVK